MSGVFGTWTLEFVLGCAARGRRRRLLLLREDVRAEKEPVIDVEGLHGVAQVWIEAPALEEKDELGLVEPDVRNVLERVLDALT